MKVRTGFSAASLVLLVQAIDPAAAVAADVEGDWVVTLLDQEPVGVQIDQIGLPPIFGFDLLLTTEEGAIRGIGITSGEVVAWLDEAGRQYSGIVIPIGPEQLITGIEVNSQVPFTAVRAP